MGVSVFGHGVTYNKALPDDWTTVYKRDLNDPGNLMTADGSPDYFKTQEYVSAAAPQAVCSVCLSHVYSSPEVSGGRWAQAQQDFYMVNGLGKGHQSFDAAGSLLLGSDTIGISTQKTADSAWKFNYFNLTTNELIFTAKVWLLDSTGSTFLPDDFGYAIDHLGGFGPVPSSLAYELEFTAPGFGGKDVDVMVPPSSFEDALP